MSQTAQCQADHDVMAQTALSVRSRARTCGVGSSLRSLPQGPSLFSFYSSRSPSPPASPPPFCPTALSVYGCMNRSISLPKSQLTSNPTIALIIEAPPHCAFISMTTHKEEREQGRRRKIAEAGKNVNERVGVPSVDLWFNCEEGNTDDNS